MFVLMLVLVLSICWIINYKRKRSRLVKYVNKFKGPPTAPIFGNVLSLLGTPTDYYFYLLKMQQLYGSALRIWLLNVPVIIVSNPDDVQIILKKNLEKERTYKFLADLIGDGLITSDLKRWKRNRQIISPAFNLTTLADYFLESFNDQNEKLVNKLKKECDTDEAFDVWKYIDTTSFSTICETAMGYTEDEETEFLKSREAYMKASDLVGERFYKIWLHPDFVFKLYTRLIGMTKIFEEAKALPKMILKKKYQNRETNSMLLPKEDRNNSSNQKLTKRKQCIVDILYDLHDKENYFTEEELIDEILTLIFAGSETTAITVSFTLLMLAIEQDIQSKVHEELDSVFGTGNEPPTAEDLNQLNYLEKCVKETLRRFTIVPIILRQTDEDIILKNGLIIPRGANINISLAGIHLNEKTYPNPYTWNPDNFNKECISKRHPSSFIPFGTGIRMCLGYKYSMMSMKAQLCTLLRNFHVTSPLTKEDIKLNFDVVVRSANGYRIKLHSRSKNLSTIQTHFVLKNN